MTGSPETPESPITGSTASISESSDDAIVGIAASDVITTRHRAAAHLYGYR